MKTTEERLECAMQALNAIAAIKDSPGSPSNDGLLVVAIALARVTVDNIGPIP